MAGRSNHERVIVNVPEPVQAELPVSIQVPVIVDHVVLPEVSVVPVAVPVIDIELPPDCTVNVKFAVVLVVVVEVTSNVPLAVSPVTGKQGPVVRKLKEVTLSAPLVSTENDVWKLKTPTPASVPINADSQVPFAAVTVAGVLLPQPLIVSSSASNTRTATFFMNLPRVRKLNAKIAKMQAAEEGMHQRPLSDS